MSARRRARLTLTAAWALIVLAAAVLVASQPTTVTVLAAGAHGVALLGLYVLRTVLVVGIAVTAWAISAPIRHRIHRSHP